MTSNDPIDELPDGEQASESHKFGPTEFGLVRVGPEDWTPSQRLAAFVVGGMAIVVGVMGLLGISIVPRDRR